MLSPAEFVPFYAQLGVKKCAAPLREFWSWWPAKHGWGPNGDILGCYALHNVTSGRGFFDLYAWGIL